MVCVCLCVYMCVCVLGGVERKEGFYNYREREERGGG